MTLTRSGENRKYNSYWQRDYYYCAERENDGTRPITLPKKTSPEEKVIRAAIEQLGEKGLPLLEEYKKYSFALGCYNAGVRRAIIAREEAGTDWFLQGKPLEDHPLHEDLDFINGYNRAKKLSSDERKRGR